MELIFHETENYVCIRLEGKVDGTAITAALSMVITDPRYRQGMNRLWDYRGVEFDGATLRSIEKNVVDTKKLGPSLENVKIAIVVDSTLNYGLCRQFESLWTMERNVTSKTFRSLEQAEQWLTGSKRLRQC